jgi:signal peptidase
LNKYPINGKINYKKLLSIISNVILVLLLIIGIFVGVTLLPIKNNFKILAVMSGSMKPTIEVGSLAVIRPANDYKVSDIITFNQPNTTSKKETTTHRIQSISEKNGGKAYTTKGDANNSSDSQTIVGDQIVGKYLFSIALLGYLLSYLKTLPGLIIIIVIPATIIIYEEVRKIGREAGEIRKRRRQRKDKLKPEIEKEEKPESKSKESKKISHDIKVHKK